MAAHDPIPAPCSKAEQSNWVNMFAQLKAPFVDGKHSWSHDGVLSPGFVAGHDSGRSVASAERHRAAASSQELRMLLKRAALGVADVAGSERGANSIAADRRRFRGNQ